MLGSVRFEFKQLNTHTLQIQNAHDHQYQPSISISPIHHHIKCLKNTFYGCFQWPIVLRDEFLYFRNFLVEKYGSSASKCRIGCLHTTLNKFFTFKSKIYMKKPQNVAECPLSGYPARLSTSYIYEASKHHLSSNHRMPRKNTHFPSRSMENEHLRNLLTCASLYSPKSCVAPLMFQSKLFVHHH